MYRCYWDRTVIRHTEEVRSAAGNRACGKGGTEGIGTCKENLLWSKNIAKCQCENLGGTSKATKCFEATWNYDTKIKGFILEAWSLIKSSDQQPFNSFHANALLKIQYAALKVLSHTLCKFNFLRTPFFFSPSSIKLELAGASTRSSFLLTSFSISFALRSSVLPSAYCMLSYNPAVFSRLTPESNLPFFRECECLPCRKERRECVRTRLRSGASIVAFGEVSASGCRRVVLRSVSNHQSV
jgi:hypothetical protein